MKKLILLSMVVAFVLVGAQAFASPPIAPPPEGFIIQTTTQIIATGTVIENESYNWTYFEGWGKGPLFPAGYTARGCQIGGTGCVGQYSELGFTEGAEIAYQQTFNAPNGITSFNKTFEAYSNPDAAKFQDNLMVHKEITYNAVAGSTSVATHTEKVGLSVVSMGQAAGTGSPASATGLLSLCPWAAQGGGSLVSGYPPTNEGIAAGSKFVVSSITNFVSDSKVNSTVNPSLIYNVDAPLGGTTKGKGFIEAGFVVELYEGPAGTTWAPIPATGACYSCAPVVCDSRTGTGCFTNAQTPPLASRTSYKEYASANGEWTFSKHMKYSSIMPPGSGAGTASTFPFNTVLP